MLILRFRSMFSFGSFGAYWYVSYFGCLGLDTLCIGWFGKLGPPNDYSDARRGIDRIYMNIYEIDLDIWPSFHVLLAKMFSELERTDRVRV